MEETIPSFVKVCGVRACSETVEDRARFVVIFPFCGKFVCWLFFMRPVKYFIVFRVEYSPIVVLLLLSFGEQ